MASKRDAAMELAHRWEQDAFGYERQAKGAEYSPIEKRLLDMHARVKRACANELKLTAGKLGNG